MLDGKGIHIGTSGWVYPHWKGLFYPAGLPQRSWLKYYSSQFDTTEINASFYRLPTRETLEKWQETTCPCCFSVPQNQLFYAKTELIWQAVPLVF